MLLGTVGEGVLDDDDRLSLEGAHGALPFANLAHEARALVWWGAVGHTEVQARARGVVDHVGAVEEAGAGRQHGGPPVCLGARTNQASPAW